jgi:hypothetical protein
MTREWRRRQREARRRDPFEDLHELLEPRARSKGGDLVDALAAMLAANRDPASAYRHMARAAHPDAGGTDEMMVALNAAWERVVPS